MLMLGHWYSAETKTFKAAAEFYMANLYPGHYKFELRTSQVTSMPAG